MKTYMPLDGFRWSCDSDSALCDIPQTNVLGQAGGGGRCLVESVSPNLFCLKEFCQTATNYYLMGAF